MSNFIVPNTFVPGTKAKAQEVNENFTSVQNELNLKAEKSGNSSQAFSVGTATENSHAINKQQFENAIAETSTNLGDLVSRIGDSFVIERAYTNSSGNPAFMTYSGSVLSFLADDGTTYGPIVAKPANNMPRFSLTSVEDLDLGSYANGTYNLYLRSNGTAYIFNSRIFIQNATPANPTNTTIFVNTSIFPMTAQTYQNSTWVDFNDIHIGTVTITNNVITGVSYEKFNNNTFNLNKSNTTILTTAYINGYSGYRLYSDGYCEQWGKTGTKSGATQIVLYIPYKDAYYNIQVGATLYTSSDTIANGSISSVAAASFYHYERYTYGSYWKTCGYVNI